MSTRLNGPRPTELVAAALVLVVGLGEVWVPFSSRQGAGSTLSTSLAVLVTAATLLWSRRRPVLALAVVLVTWASAALIAPPYVLFYGTFVPILLLVFAGARWGAGTEPLYAAGLVAAALLGVDLFVPLLSNPEEIAFHWTVAALVWSAGVGLRTWERRTQAALGRAVRAEREAAERAFHAVLEERARLSREIHDIVSHAVSSMVVQAGAGEQAADDDPEFTKKTLAAIRRTGSEALDEMRRLVALLRTTDEAPLAPQPRLAGLDSLLEESNQAGIATRLTVEGEVRGLPAGLDVAVYRIVQEALTNVRKHAGARRCDVSLAYGPQSLTVRVLDDGQASRVPGAGGHGLIGMRERVHLFGGELSTGPVDAGGYLVEARLPVG